MRRRFAQLQTPEEYLAYLSQDIERNIAFHQPFKVIGPGLQGDRTFGVKSLLTIALVHMRSDPRTRIYIERRTGKGLSTKEILRYLKHDIVREVYPLIFSDLAHVNRPSLT